MNKNLENVNKVKKLSLEYSIKEHKLRIIHANAKIVLIEEEQKELSKIKPFFLLRKAIKTIKEDINNLESEKTELIKIIGEEKILIKQITDKLKNTSF